MQPKIVGSVHLGRSPVVVAALVISALVLFFTRPENAGDSLDYARDVASAPFITTPSLYEPGHLLWRPIGVGLRDLLGRPASSSAAAIRDAQRTLSIVSVIAAAVLTACIGLIVLGTVGSLAAAVSAMVLAAFSAAVVNFGQVGSAYVPGIAIVALAVWTGTPRPETRRGLRYVVAGALLAVGVLIWLPYVLVVPASLLAMYLVSAGPAPDRRRALLLATASCAFVGIGAYAGAAAAHGVRSLPALIAWISGSSHGISRPGLARVIIGLPRSFVHMGSDGREIRRYLLGDSLNPVSASQVAMLPVWPKLLVFYSVLVAVSWFAFRRPAGRRLLLVFLVALVPVAGFGAAWSGGEEERYLALVPFLLPLLIWAAWSAGREKHRALAVAIGIFSLLWLGNLRALSTRAAHARSTQANARLGCAASMLDARSVIIVPEQSDPLVAFSRGQLDELPRHAGTQVVYVLPPRAKPGLTWDGTLDAVVRSTIDSGGRVWVPAYVLDATPPSSTGWVEGGLETSWTQVRNAFSALQLRRPCDDTQLLEVVEAPPLP